MKNNNTLIAVVVILLVAGGIYYYQKHTHTASVDLPGGHGVSVTTHD